ncbi:MAG: carbohydrate ABC transporter permease [Lachnospiraceae bacterium]|nr:carbohydrate ABC transporter permease [Lachnospiraceae bacterium]
MKIRKGKLHGWTFFDTVITIIASIALALTLYPMIYVFSCSFSDTKAVLAGEVVLWPVGFSLKAYEIVMQNVEYWRSMLNSVGYVIANCILMFLTTVSMAYPLSRPNLKFRKFVTYFLLIPMYFGGGMIPTYLLISKLGLYNTPWALILPGCYGIWNIILCRTFMASLPEELIDSSLIDGCSQFATFRKIVIPLSKPVIAVIMIYTIVGTWNAWFGASIYTSRQELWPVQLYLKHLLAATTATTDQKLLESLSKEAYEAARQAALSANQIKYSMIILTTAPIIAVYPMFQKHFTKGIMLGSLKG